MPKSIEEQVAAFRASGFGPQTVARFERSLRETAEFGPLGFVQRDIDRMTAAITGAGVAGAPGPRVLARVTKLAADAVDMPIQDARRVRRALQRIADTAGIPLP